MTLVHMRGLNAPVRSERDAQAEIARRRLLEALTAARQVVALLTDWRDEPAYYVDVVLGRAVSTRALCDAVITLHAVTSCMDAPSIAQAYAAALQAECFCRLLARRDHYRLLTSTPKRSADTYAMGLQVDVLCRDAIAALEGLPVSTPSLTTAPADRDQPAKPVFADPASADLKLDDLPPPGATRWVIRRKALVVAGVKRGLLTAQQACERYDLDAEELEGWCRLVERHGEKGLRVTRIQQYRRRDALRDEQAGAA